MTTTVSDEAGSRAERHVLRDLGWAVARSGDELIGSATVVPEMHVPGTGHLRTSILATWADVLAGLLAVDVIAPRVPVTLELDVHLFGPAPSSGVVRGLGRTVKAGRSVFMASVDFLDDDGEVFGFSGASFMAAPDTRMTISTKTSVDQSLPKGTRLQVPLAERARCERVSPGVAVLAPSDDTLNASNTVNGGLIALTVEEAALSLTPGTTLSSLGLRYLQPVRHGPVVAEAEVLNGLGRAEVRDAGNDNRLCVVATSRTFS